VVTLKPITGSKEEWLRLSGIPETEWGYVDFIVQKESGWNPNAINKSSGACGLVQSLPCSKLGANWNDPVHALQWQYRYVTDRYGGYAQAVAFWQNNHWY
jgi:soluble lytic murein transglycosylase-like protein